MVQLARGKAGKRKTKKKNRQSTQPTTEPNSAHAKKKPSSHRLRNALILIVSSIIILSACILSVNHPLAPQQTQEPTNTNQPTQQPTNTNTNAPKAAILDGLYDKSPNQTLLEDMTQYLTTAGYTVDVYKGTNVTIDLLRNIAGYKILILRLHSTIHTDNFLYVFSGETYTESKYVDEQLTGAVRKAYTFNETEPPYFALNSVFIGKLKPNSLNGTTLIMMGCNGTANQYVIQRFLQEGIKTYISWDGYVDLPHSDEATLRLIKAIYIEGLNPKAAVDKVNRELGPDPTYNSTLICAPP